MQFTTIVASALAVALAAAVPQTPPTYGSNSTAPIYPVTNGTTTTTTGAAAPSGTASAPVTSGIPAYTGGASQIFGSSAAMGLAIVGGIALAL